ncbi:putative Exonuclease V [Hypsibius exemplaris]|uniref:Exonuclease V n=1 Tax=Hypsibius exemplaris TaxID=2072580 RepID=A0A1W0WR67_HYPEX|nr:putative Exonuclease V [Hypsibius exemplaris]
MEQSYLDDGESELFNNIDMEDLIGPEPSAAVENLALVLSPSVIDDPDVIIISPSDIFSNGSRTTTSPRKLAQKKTPLETLRPRYFFVSDFVAYTWCSQKAYFSILNPGFEEMIQEIKSVSDPTKKIQPVMKIGTAIHVTRELAVHAPPKPVKTCGPEDLFAIRLLNTFTLLHALILGKPVEREIPVFGMPLDLGILIFGKIDEINLDHTTGMITLSETKTRNSEREPRPPQQIGHRLQVMLYKRLLEDIIQGKMNWRLILNILHLKSEKKFSEAVQKEIICSGLSADHLDLLFRQVTAMTAALSGEIVLNVEYVYQGTKKTFLTRTVEYDEEWLREQMTDFVHVWTMRKPMLGAPVHEAWKCHDCSFGDICEWKQARIPRRNTDGTWTR